MRQKHKFDFHKLIKLAQSVCLILIAQLFFPLPAVAHPGIGILLIPVYMLFLIFLSALLAAIVKLRLVKTKSGLSTELSLRDIRGLTILEAVIMALFVMIADFSIPRDFTLGIIRYALWVSDEIAIWYFQIFFSCKIFLFWCVVLFITASINSIFSLLPNLELLTEHNEGFLRTIKQPKKIVYAGLLGLIAPGLLSIVILFFPSIAEINNSRSSKVNSNILSDKKVLKELMIQSASTGYPKLVAAFFKKGCDPNDRDKYGNTALMIASSEKASKERQYEVIKLLLERGADINAKDKGGKTALMRASNSKKYYFGRQLEVVKLLLNNKADVNANSMDGTTALMWACSTAKNSFRQLEIVKLLLEKGADVNARDINGKTALIKATEHSNRSNLIKILLKNKANVNAKDNYGNSALSISSSSRFGIDAVKVLLEKGADVNSKDQNGITPLMNACSYHGKLEVVRLLVENGANVNAKDKYGQTALMIASRKPYRFRELLIKYGAKE